MSVWQVLEGLGVGAFGGVSVTWTREMIRRRAAVRKLIKIHQPKGKKP